MTNEQYERQQAAERWLYRMWDTDSELKELEGRRANIIASLSGIGKYDDKAIPGGCDSNPTETKNLEYSRLSKEIEELQTKIARENARTIEVIYKIEDSIKDASKIRGMLVGRYVHHKSWKKIGEQYNYQERQSYNYRSRCLETIFPFIPKGEILNEDR